MLGWIGERRYNTHARTSTPALYASPRLYAHIHLVLCACVRACVCVRIKYSTCELYIYQHRRFFSASAVPFLFLALISRLVRRCSSNFVWAFTPSSSPSPPIPHRRSFPSSPSPPPLPLASTLPRAHKRTTHSHLRWWHAFICLFWLTNCCRRECSLLPLLLRCILFKLLHYLLDMCIHTQYTFDSVHVVCVRIRSLELYVCVCRIIW